MTTRELRTRLQAILGVAGLRVEGDETEAEYFEALRNVADRRKGLRI